MDIQECAKHCSRTHSCDWFVHQHQLGNKCQLVGSGTSKIGETRGQSSSRFTACVKKVPGCYLANGKWWIGSHPGEEA